MGLIIYLLLFIKMHVVRQILIISIQIFDFDNKYTVLFKNEATLEKSNIYWWYKMFSEGPEEVSDEERSGRPSTSTRREH